MNIEKVQFLNNLNQKLHGRIYKKDRSRSGVIFCHGLFSDKDGYKISKLTGTIVESGYALLVFDFSFCGESEGNISEISLLQEVEDLKCAVNYFLSRGIEDIHLIGSSMGGTIAILYASGDENIRSIITIAAPVNLLDLSLGICNFSSSDEIDSLDEKGFTLVDNIPVNNSFFKEMKKIDVIASLRKIRVPLLSIHGEEDDVVNINDLYLIRENHGGENKTIEIKYGDHTLTGDEDIYLIGEHISQWLEERL